MSKNFVAYGDAETLMTGINEKLKSTFIGTVAEWEALTTQEKDAYTTAHLSGDLGGTAVITDEVASGNMNPVTSNAVYGALDEKLDFVKNNDTSRAKAQSDADGSVYYFLANENDDQGILKLFADGHVELQKKASGGSWSTIISSVETTGTATINSTYVSDGSVTWEKVGKVVEVRINRLVITNSATFLSVFATGLPAPASMTWPVVASCGSSYQPLSLQMSSSNGTGQIAFDSGIDTVDKLQNIYGSFVYMTN